MTAKEHFDRNAIESSIKEIGTHGEGKLSSVGVLDVVVLKGTFLEMGRQYGALLKDKILAVRDELIKEYIDPEILDYDTMKQIIGEPFYKSQPKRIKDLYAGISEATGLDVIELSTIDQQFMLVLLARRTGQTAMCTALISCLACSTLIFFSRPMKASARPRQPWPGMPMTYGTACLIRYSGQFTR